MMKNVSVREIAEGLSAALEAPVEEVETPRASRGGPDAVLSAGDVVFVVEMKGAASAEVVGRGIRQLKGYAEGYPRSVPLLVVSYMGDVGKQMCRDDGISWLDLSGNANIVAPGIRVRIEGRPNKSRSARRAPNIFSPASSRVARALLLTPQRSFTQEELAKLTGLDRGTTSRVVRRYEEAGFLRRKGQGRGSTLEAPNPSGLLDAWRKAYEFSKHDLRAGHIVSRTGEELLHALAGKLEEHDVDYAATGLAAAWLIEPFAMFRLVTVYVRDWPSEELLQELRFHEDPKGANVWLVRPKDEGVFDGGEERDGIRHVSAVQVYLDLKAQPERSEEAAEELRRNHLHWGESGGTQPDA